MGELPPDRGLAVTAKPAAKAVVAPALEPSGRRGVGPNPKRLRSTRRGAAIALASGLLIGLLVFAAFRILPPLAAAEARARDVAHAYFHPAAPTRDDIVLILIEEATLATLPYRSPIDRGFLADLLGSIQAHGPRAVALDLLLDQPTEPAKDAALFARLAAPGAAPVVVAAADEADGLTTPQADYLGAATASARIGQAALLFDPANDVVRATPPAREIRGRRAPALSAAMAEAAGVAAPPGGFDIVFAPPMAGADLAPRLVAAFHPYFTAEQISGKFILIGVSLDNVDRHATPLDVVSAGAETPGVESHAHALAHILDGRSLREVGVGGEAIFAAGAAGLTVIALVAPIPVLIRTLVAALTLVFFAAAPALALAHIGVRTPVLTPLIAGAVAGVVVAFARWRAEATTRRRLRDAFGRFVAPEVVREIEAAPDALRLGGEKRDLTCVFTDVAGFTTLCEGLEAEELVDLLNRYLGGASEVFVNHGGTIDKFVGDAVVGFFGAPAWRDDHAAAAIRMAVALDGFATGFAAAEAKRGRSFGVTRIGVHSGEATVGNFGGDLFFDYTAMGDTVNVAARLEGANKAFGGRLCISDDALAEAGGAVDGILTRPVGRLRVKGRDAPLLVHEAFAPGDARAAVQDDYLAAYAALERDPEEAATRFAALADAWPDDGLITFHADRAAEGERGAVVTLKEK